MSLPYDCRACPTNTVYYDGSCYAYQSGAGNTKNWQDAEKYCQSTFNGHLAKITSTDQQNFIVTTVTKNCSNCVIYGFWVGGNNYGNCTTKSTVTTCNWKWSDGTTASVMPRLTAYRKDGWAVQPNDPKNEQCMTLV